MPKDIASVQRELANLQRQIKQLTDRSKREEDPKRKADLQKQIIDLNTKRSELDKEMEDAVADMHVGSELAFAEGFTKWNKYKKDNIKKLTETTNPQRQVLVNVEKILKKNGLRWFGDYSNWKVHTFYITIGRYASNPTAHVSVTNDDIKNVNKSIDDLTKVYPDTKIYTKDMMVNEYNPYSKEYVKVKKIRLYIEFKDKYKISSTQTESKITKNKLTEAEKKQVREYAKSLTSKKLVKESAKYPQPGDKEVFASTEYRAAGGIILKMAEAFKKKNPSELARQYDYLKRYMKDAITLRELFRKYYL